ncbi:hypothetical protein AB0C52_12945 [Streptomyces sp. NPDC048717]|uniref:hypothetical protein n=1 Tax=Streptomyces sp. NPDC048717 TaxID=3154928 RepID=UPI00342776C4
MSTADAVAGTRQPAADMRDLADVVRTLLGVQAGEPTRASLGGALFDAVVTSSSPRAHDAVALMDSIQGGCGPVIDYGDFFYWLVPPGSAARWAPHEHALCLGAPHTITLPPPGRTAPPGPYWLRQHRRDRLVPADPLWGIIAQLQPEPSPHTALADRFGGVP